MGLYLLRKKEQFVKVYAVSSVMKWLKKQRSVTTSDLLIAATEVVEGKCEARMGNIYKKRLASKSGQGKSGGSRLIIGFKVRHDMFILYVFDKNKADNITAQDRDMLRIEYKFWLSLNNAQIEAAIKAEEITELKEVTE
jgi:hypothetical protein